MTEGLVIAKMTELTYTILVVIPIGFDRRITIYSCSKERIIGKVLVVKTGRFLGICG